MTISTDQLLTLPAATPDGQARTAALAVAVKIELAPTSRISYESKGRLLIIGPQAQAVAAAKALRERLECVVLATTDRPANGADGGALPDIPVAHEKLVQLTGHLGQFAAIVAAPSPLGGVNLLQKIATGYTHFDLVLDLGTPPVLAQELPPFGYFAPGGDAEKLRRAMAELPEMVGEFEKPKFFKYDPDICAHGGSGLTGCTRCLDVCPASAIISMGEEIAIDPYLCQGGGACATACPTGAVSYTYPTASDGLGKLRELLRAYRNAGGAQPILLFHDAEEGKARVVRLAARLPEWVIPVEVAELGSVGMEIWLAALAYGAHAVALLATPVTPKSVNEELTAQLDYARAILQGMGYAPERLWLSAADDDAIIAALARSPVHPQTPPASFAGFDEKRTNIKLAVAHLHAHAPKPQESVALPEGAPYGEVIVDQDACTLCLACVSVCPVRALSDGQDLPQLRFDEALCVQCGLCEVACPEDAIKLAPRFSYAAQLQPSTRVLHEEPPFCCIVCDKPFATRAMIDKMTEKLKGHWMFQKPDALDRIKMCDDCRVKAMFKAERNLLS